MYYCHKHKYAQNDGMPSCPDCITDAAQRMMKQVATANNNARDEILLCYPNSSCEWNDRGECKSANQCICQRKTSPVA